MCDWRTSPFNGEVPGYQALTHGKGGIGGMMRVPDGMRPDWLGYVGVEDVDAAVGGIIRAGGILHMPARDLPNAGRIAMVAEPQGVPFHLMRGTNDQLSIAFDPDAVATVPGTVGDAWPRCGGSVRCRPVRLEVGRTAADE